MFTWIIELILSGLPGWIWPATAGAGFAVYFFAAVIGHFPAFKAYTLFIRPVGALVCIGGIFMWGGSGVTAIWQAQIEEMKHKVELATAQSATANAQIETKIITKTKVIHDKQVVIQERIKEVEKRIDADCRLDSEVPKILNEAARNPLQVAK
jgi:hypothetical protein